MREIKINVSSDLYKIYRSTLSKWESPPTRASLPSFIYAIFLYVVREVVQFKELIMATLYALVLLASVLNIIGTIEDLGGTVGRFAHDIMAGFILATATALFVVMAAKPVYGLVRGCTSTFISWVKKKTELPTIKFVGHPRSMYEIEEIGENYNE